MNPQSRRPALALLVCLGAVALLGAYVTLRFRMTTDISAFMPAGSDRVQFKLSRQLIGGELSRTMILTIGAPNVDTATQASRALEKRLRADSRITKHLDFLEAGPPPGAQKAIWKLYQPRRFSFTANSLAQLKQRLSDSALSAAAKRLKQQLAQPTSALLSKTAPADPLLILPDLFDRLQGSRGQGLQLHDDRFVTADQRFAVLFLGCKASAFNSKVQGPWLAAIDEAFAALNGQHQGRLVLDKSGVNRFAVAAERAIKSDIRRVSIFSLLGLSLLLLLLFRSLRLIGLASIPLGVGVLAGCAAVLTIFGRIHGITLAFGASLIGVSFDYVVHLYCHHAAAPAEQGGAHGTLRGIWKAILTGAATTMLGFAALGASTFQGLQEVAIFATVGLAGTLAATRYILPSLIPERCAPVGLRTAIIERLSRFVAGLRGNRPVLWLLPLVAVVVTAIGMPRATWNDRFASLGSLDAQLLAEDQRVRSRVSHAEQMRFAIALGDTEEQALQVNDRIASALAEARQAKHVDDFRSVATLLPSARTQRAVHQALRDAPQLKQRFARAFSAEGFVPQAFEPFFAAIAKEPPTPLTFDQLSASPLGLLVRPFRLKVGNQTAFVTLLNQVRDADALRSKLSQIEGATFIEQADLMARLNRDYQERAAMLLGVGLLGVLLLLGLRYRRPRRTLAGIAPALLAASATIATLAIVGLKIDLVVLTSVLMVVSMGVDYSVFLVDAATADKRHLSASLLSVSVAGASTLLGFGLLSFSEHPVLHSIGLTAALGIVASLLLAPAAVILLKTEA